MDKMFKGNIQIGEFYMKFAVLEAICFVSKAHFRSFEQFNQFRLFPIDFPR